MAGNDDLVPARSCSPGSRPRLPPPPDTLGRHCRRRQLRIDGSTSVHAAPTCTASHVASAPADDPAASAQRHRARCHVGGVRPGLWPATRAGANPCDARRRCAATDGENCRLLLVLGQQSSPSAAFETQPAETITQRRRLLPRTSARQTGTASAEPCPCRLSGTLVQGTEGNANGGTPSRGRNLPLDPFDKAVSPQIDYAMAAAFPDRIGRSTSRGRPSVTPVDARAAARLRTPSNRRGDENA